MKPNDFYPIAHEPICERCLQEIERDAPMIGVWVGDKQIGTKHECCPDEDD